MKADQVLLAADNVSKYYGDFVALEGVSLSVSSGEFVSVVGPNGAGKTTLVNVLTGLHQPNKGAVHFAGQDIAGVSAVDLSTRGLARAFQLVSVFPDLTVRETLAVAACSYLGLRWSMFRDVMQRKRVNEIVTRAADAFGMSSSLDTPANLLPHGKRKLLDVASAFALHPKVMLLDEPTAGVSTADKHGVMETLLSAAKSMGVAAIMLVEHDMDLVARYSSRIIAMQGGRKIADLPTKEFFADEVITSIVVGKGGH
ncbi:MAG TPA: ATP-binding cassette domain-containing protein [Burkholderiales bacterium]|jgi:ABC-type branched-chain amino acid transport systems, ATPase component|nr:ATP-binding cassette domain-containing protein [Bryobacteraceae bacterium]